MARFAPLTVQAIVMCLGISCAAALAAKPIAAFASDAHVRVEPTSDPKIKKVTFSERAAERLGIQMDEVRVDPSGRRIVPYATIVYDLQGGTWVYVSAGTLSFVRSGVKIESIKGENVYLSDGPPQGTKLLAAAVPQVFGAEVGVGH
jgi:hypothetical protein